jgi:hypothetical protein
MLARQILSPPQQQPQPQMGPQGPQEMI